MKKIGTVFLVLLLSSVELVSAGENPGDHLCEKIKPEDHGGDVVRVICLTQSEVSKPRRDGTDAFVAQAQEYENTCFRTDPFEAVDPSDPKIIIIHGFWPIDIVEKPSCGEVLTRRDREYTWPTVDDPGDPVSDFWDDKAVVRVDWSSNYNLEEVAERFLYPLMARLSRTGWCEPSGCLIIDHSTGDNLANLWLTHGPTWLNKAGLDDVPILATFDFAGASGGTELANLYLTIHHIFRWFQGPLWWLADTLQIWWLMDALQSQDWGELNVIKQALQEDFADLGVLHDLSINAARNRHDDDRNGVPRLRIVGESAQGDDSDSLYGLAYILRRIAFVSSLFSGPTSFGSNDGVVPAHSACGAADYKPYTSCFQNYGLNGQAGIYLAPAPLTLRNMHYPLMVTGNYNHEEIWSVSGTPIGASFWRTLDLGNFANVSVPMGSPSVVKADSKHPAELIFERIEAVVSQL